MDTLFNRYDEGDDNDDAADESLRDYKIDIDELYEHKKKSSLVRLSMYNKILKRIHQRIKITSRQRTNNTICSFIMPEIMIGFPTYDIGDCLVYIMAKLEENGFLIKYIHPNLLLISWNHWVPDYVRNEFKKKTGVEIDSYGNKVPTKKEKIIEDLQRKSSTSTASNKKASKKSDGNKLLDLKTKMLYDNDIISKITGNL